jgi:hypothetical protein
VAKRHLIRPEHRAALQACKAAAVGPALDDACAMVEQARPGRAVCLVGLSALSHEKGRS